MQSFLLALQFLTVIPIRVKHTSEKKLSAAVAYFPLVGLLLGVFLTLAYKGMVYFGFPEFSSDVILVVTLVLLTGGLHLDGLADSVDAFLSRKNKDQMLEIMRDSHIGAMGVIGLICVILLKISFLYCLYPQFKTNALLLMCVFSRWAMVFSLFSFPYARQEGKAKVFSSMMNLKLFLYATIGALVIAVLVWGMIGTLILLAIIASAYLANRIIKSKIGGITGDTLGALNEIIEVLVLFFICILQGVIYG